MIENNDNSWFPMGKALILKEFLGINKAEDDEETDPQKAQILSCCDRLEAIIKIIKQWEEDRMRKEKEEKDLTHVDNTLEETIAKAYETGAASEYAKILENEILNNPNLKMSKGFWEKFESWNRSTI